MHESSCVLGGAARRSLLTEFSGMVCSLSFFVLTSWRVGFAGGLSAEIILSLTAILPIRCQTARSQDTYTLKTWTAWQVLHEVNT